MPSQTQSPCRAWPGHVRFSVPKAGRNGHLVSSPSTSTIHRPPLNRNISLGSKARSAHSPPTQGDVVRLVYWSHVRAPLFGVLLPKTHTPANASRSSQTPMGLGGSPKPDRTLTAMLQFRDTRWRICATRFPFSTVPTVTHVIAGIGNASLDLCCGWPCGGYPRTRSSLGGRCIPSKQLPRRGNISFAVTTPAPVIRGAVSHNLGQLGRRQLIEPL